MDENTERTPHPEEPAEGSTDIDSGGAAAARDGGSHSGDPADIPAHNSAPDGYVPADAGTDASSGARDGTHVTDADAADGTGGAIQGDSPLEESTGGAIQGDAGPHRDAPLGGDRTTEQQLDADNEVEEDTLKTLDPDDPPA